MSIERFDVDHERYLGHPDPNGDLCYYKDVEQLEAQHAAVCAILKSVSDSARKTYVRVYTDETGEWSNLYSYNVPYDVIRAMRNFIEDMNITEAKP